MKVIVYRSFSSVVEVPEPETELNDAEFTAYVQTYLDENNNWPNVLDEQELYDEFSAIKL